ncbi:MAG: hydrolase [Pseudomonadota bacterium]
MANFNTHFSASAVQSGVLVCGLLALGHVEPQEAALGFVLGTAAGLAPDLDAERSTPVSVAFSVLALLLAFAAVFAVASRLSIAESVVLWVVIYAAVRLVLAHLFAAITTHRGMYHSLPAALLAGVLVANALHSLFGQTAFISTLHGLVVTLAYLQHLVLDELVSVNLTGRRVKRSFGTALKLFDRRNLFTTALTWGLLALALAVVPDPGPLRDLFVEQNLLANLRAIGLPNGVWFETLVNRPN